MMRRVPRLSQFVPARLLAARRYGAVLLAGLLLLFSKPGFSGNENAGALKAAFLYNFALYTEWPVLPTSFELCVAGRDDMGEALDALSRRQVAGRSINVRRIDGNEVPASCNLLFVAASERGQCARWLGAVRGRPILTISDFGLHEEAQAMLHLHVEQGRLVFTASQSRAKGNGLSFSAKMLRLARAVD